MSLLSHPSVFYHFIRYTVCLRVADVIVYRVTRTIFHFFLKFGFMAEV